MEKFIVSARKYRPQTFDTVVGQSHITTTLKNAIRQQHLAHAFLFCGPRGVGKTTCARILAKTINCENITPEGEACNECHSCTSFNEGSSLNIHELDAASNNSVEDIRTLVEQVRFPPQAGTYKVYIIDEVHMLSSSAFNAFLKTLEEPPPYAIFILATTEKHKILPTILSRCQIFDFKRITPQDTVDHLQEICTKEEVKAEEAALHVIAQKSEGCMRDALSIMDKIVSFTGGVLTYANTLEHLNILDADYFFKLLKCMQDQDLAGSLLLYDDINKKGFEGDMLLNGFAEFIRNLLVCKDNRVASLLEVVSSFKDKYLQAAAETSTSWLISALNILNESEISFRMARNKRLHVELTLIKLTYLNQALELSSEGVAKKKLAEARPLQFKRLQPIEVKAAPVAEAKLTIETPAVKPVVVAPSVVEKKPATAAASKPVETPKGGGKLSQLTKIRQQVIGKQEDAEKDKPIPVTEDKLKEAWTGYTQLLREAKNPASQSFDIARLTVTSEQSFEVSCNNNLEQKFIEGERSKLSEYLQQFFNNKSLLYSILVDDNGEYDIPVERPLNNREQFMQMIEQYPLVKELKDRLRLELDY